jgi:hypothetical protein
MALRICNCDKPRCLCRRAYTEAWHMCFDCWDGSHFYGKVPKEDREQEQYEARKKITKAR